MIYVDSSSLVKRYLLEAGTDALNARLAQEDHVVTSVLTYAEIHSALARKHRERWLSRKSFQMVRRAFDREWAILERVRITDEVLSRVPRLLERYPLRANDALQLSSALLFSPALVFVSSDLRLLEAADGCRLKAWNPAAHESSGAGPFPGDRGDLI